MTYLVVRPPAAEPLAAAELAEHLRIDTREEDALLAGLLGAARDHLERAAGLCLIEQGLRLYLDAPPGDGVVAFSRGPVRSVEGVIAYDALGRPQTLPPARLRLLPGREARLFLPPGLAPDLPLEIEFTAGYGTSGAAVPPALKRALLLHAGAMHAFRGAVPLEDQPAEMPAGYDRLIAPFCLRRL